MLAADDSVLLVQDCGPARSLRQALGGRIPRRCFGLDFDLGLGLGLGNVQNELVHRGRKIGLVGGPGRDEGAVAGGAGGVEGGVCVLGGGHDFVFEVC